MLYDSEDSLRDVLHDYIQIYFVFLNYAITVNKVEGTYLISLSEESMT